MSTDTVREVHELVEYQQIINDEPCVVKFTAVWCGPCKRFAPVYKAAAEKHSSNIAFLEIDIDQATEITNHEDIKSVPTFIFYVNGQKIAQFSGGSKAEFDTSLNNLIQKIEQNEADVIDAPVVKVTDSAAKVDLDDDSESSYEEEESDDSNEEESPRPGEQKQNIEEKDDDSDEDSSSDSEEASGGSARNEYGEDIDDLPIEKTITDDTDCTK
jgi:thioredoxin 1